MFDRRELKRLGLLLGENVKLVGENTLEAPTTIGSDSELRRCSIGAYTLVAHGAMLRRASIGRYCSIARHATIGEANHPTDWLTTSMVAISHIFDLGPQPEDDVDEEQFQTVQAVSIQNDVWVGANTFVRGGVTVGNGAIVGFGSIVTKDVPPYAIVGGNPARLIRYRFDEHLIAKLLEFEWWQYDLAAAKKDGLHITWSDPSRALDELAAAREAGTLKKIENRLRRLVVDED